LSTILTPKGLHVSSRRCVSVGFEFGNRIYRGRATADFIRWSEGKYLDAQKYLDVQLLGFGWPKCQLQIEA
jgi:hypothetical protein